MGSLKSSWQNSRRWPTCRMTKSISATSRRRSIGQTPSEGLFYRPVKQQITLRLDADIVAWFKTQTEGGKGYQTAINRVLREHVARSVSARGNE